MTRRMGARTIAAASLALVAAGPAAGGDGALTLKDVGFASPAAVRFDAKADRYLVSNIDGAPLGKDNRGFISLVTPAGQVARLKWIEGGRAGVTLNAPKGMALAAGRLYVADIDQVRVFDAGTGAPIRSIPVPGAIALTDVAVAPDGRLVVSDVGRDMDSGALFQIDRAGKASLLVRGDNLLRPNALAVRTNGEIVYAPAVGGAVLTLSSDGKVINTTTYPKRIVPPWPARSFGRLAGIVLLDDKTALVASKESQTVARLNLDHPSTLTLLIPYDPKHKNALGFPDQKRFENMPGASTYKAAPAEVFYLRDLAEPAKIGLDSKRRRLLVPEVTSNTVIIAPLPSAG